ncbi:MAG: DNA polymerase III subunit beta [Caldicoprobacterales bacterium]|jgi:DNA polymerase-3 subunit beta
MKFTCMQKKLSDSISIVQKAISPRTTHPILEGIYLKAYKGILKLIGNDLDLGIECFLDATIHSEGSVVIPSRLFGDIIRKLPNCQIDIEVTDNYLVLIRAENSLFEIQGINPDEYPDLEDIHERDPIEIDQGLLKEMIQTTIFAAAVDETRPILTGALIEISEGNINMVCLDGYRLAVRKGSIDSQKEINVIIPGKTLDEVSRIIDSSDEKINITIDEKHVLFDMGYTRIISRLLSGEFINYNQIIPQDYRTRIKFDTKSLHDAIERASILAREGKNNLIKLNIREDKLIINSNSEMGKAHEEVPISMEGEELTIAFNARYFMDILKGIRGEDSYIDFSTNISPCVFRPVEGSNFTYLLLPVRINV